MKKLMIAALIALGLAGCASNNFADKSPTEVAQAVTVKNSDFDQVAQVIGKGDDVSFIIHRVYQLKNAVYLPVMVCHRYNQH